jgi:hypothetical protein
MGHFQALMRDCTPQVDRPRHRRHRLQKFVRALETPRRVFLKEHLKENSERLREVVQLFERQRPVLMLVHHFTRRHSAIIC